MTKGKYIRTKEFRKKLSIQRKGKSYWTEERKKKHSELLKEKYKNGYAPLKGKLIGDLNPAKRLKVRKKISEKAKGKNNYFFGKHFIRELNTNWQGGKKFEKYGFNWTETLRKSIRQRDNYKCQICFKYGNNVHHIDYNKKNNNTDNLICLCTRCHSTTGKKKDRKNWTKYFNKIMEIRNGK